MAIQVRRYRWIAPGEASLWRRRRGCRDGAKGRAKVKPAPEARISGGSDRQPGGFGLRERGRGHQEIYCTLQFVNILISWLGMPRFLE